MVYWPFICRKTAWTKEILLLLQQRTKKKDRKNKKVFSTQQMRERTKNLYENWCSPAFLYATKQQIATKKDRKKSWQTKNRKNKLNHKINVRETVPHTIFVMRNALYAQTQKLAHTLRPIPWWESSDFFLVVPFIYARSDTHINIV